MSAGELPDDPAEPEDPSAGSGARSNPPVAGNQWANVQDEHRAVVEALNRDPVSFTVPSAEGITLYGGIDSHAGNGMIRKLAIAGHLDLVQQVRSERSQQADADAKTEASRADAADPPADDS